MTNPEPHTAIEAFLQLQDSARRARNEADLSFVMVNSTHDVIPYRQAFLWSDLSGVTALSGIATVDRSTPFYHWLSKVLKSCGQRDTGPVEPGQLSKNLESEWQEWLPVHAYWQPLITPSGQRMGGLLLVRDDLFNEGEVTLLSPLAECYAHAWAALGPKAGYTNFASRLTRSKVIMTASAAVVAAAFFFPVPLTVLAPAETVPINPFVVRSQLDGVVEEVHVSPNQKVAIGQPLISLDPASLESRLEVAQKSLSTVVAEYRQTEQKAITSNKSKTQLAILKGRMAEKRSEVAFLQEMLGRVVIHSSQDGIVMIDDPAGWQGRPVVTGERIMVIAPEKETEIEAWLPVGDIIPLESGAGVTVYLNVAPLNSIKATIKSISYLPEERPDMTLAYRVRAEIASGQDKPQVGLMGTAKIAGEKVLLMYYIFRRPIGIIRQFLGV